MLLFPCTRATESARCCRFRKPPAWRPPSSDFSVSPSSLIILFHSTFPTLPLQDASGDQSRSPRLSHQPSWPNLLRYSPLSLRPTLFSYTFPPSCILFLLSDFLSLRVAMASLRWLWRLYLAILLAGRGVGAMEVDVNDPGWFAPLLFPSLPQ